jgi:hypothetical protein
MMEFLTLELCPAFGDSSAQTVDAVDPREERHDVWVMDDGEPAQDSILLSLARFGVFPLGGEVACGFAESRISSIWWPSDCLEVGVGIVRPLTVCETPPPRTKSRPPRRPKTVTSSSLWSWPMFRWGETSSSSNSRSVKGVCEEGRLWASSPAPTSSMLPTPELPTWSVNQTLGEAFPSDSPPSSKGEETSPGPACQRAARATFSDATPAAFVRPLPPFFLPRRKASCTRTFGDAALGSVPVGGGHGSSSSCPAHSANIGTQGTREEAIAESFALQRISPPSIKLGLFGFASSRSTDAMSYPEQNSIPTLCMYSSVTQVSE